MKKNKNMKEILKSNYDDIYGMRFCPKCLERQKKVDVLNFIIRQIKRTPQSKPDYTDAIFILGILDKGNLLSKEGKELKAYYNSNFNQY